MAEKENSETFPRSFHLRTFPTSPLFYFSLSLSFQSPHHALFGCSKSDPKVALTLIFRFLFCRLFIYFLLSQLNCWSLRDSENLLTYVLCRCRRRVFFFIFLSFSPRPNRAGIGTMHGRYGERSSGAAREKRGLDSASAEEGQPDRKRPALAR